MTQKPEDEEEEEEEEEGKVEGEGSANHNIACCEAWMTYNAAQHAALGDRAAQARRFPRVCVLHVACCC